MVASPLLTKAAQSIFQFVATKKEVADLVEEAQQLKKTKVMGLLLSLMLPFSSIPIAFQLKVRSPWVPVAINGVALVALKRSRGASGKLKSTQELLKTQGHVQHEKKLKQIVVDADPSLGKAKIIDGIGGRVQWALQNYDIESLVYNVIDAPAFWRVKLNLLRGVSVDDIKKHEAKIRTSLNSDLPIAIVEQGDCDCSIDIAKPTRERRFIKIDKFLCDGFKAPNTPVTWPAGIDANNELITVKALDPNYIHPLIGGGTGSGKSELILSWIRWLLQWQPADVQIVLIDPKQVTFGKFENLDRVANIAKTMGKSKEEVEELFPDAKEADEFAQRFAAWLPYGIVKDPKEAIKTYERMVEEMQRRYAAFTEWGVTNIEEYNGLMLRMGQPVMPTWIIVTDEYYMQVSDEKNKKPTEAELAKLGAMARACGIVLVISTQRPSYDILSTKIRDNCMWRICLRVKGLNPASIILGLTDSPDDANVTQCLAGKGDMIVEYEGRYERVQSLYWDGSNLPPVPTRLAPSDYDSPRAEDPAPELPETKPQPVAAVETPAAPAKPEPDPDRELYLNYRAWREAGNARSKFVEQAMRTASAAAQQKFDEKLAPYYSEWFRELIQQEYLPEQIVNIVWGIQVHNDRAGGKKFAEKLAIVNDILKLKGVDN